MWGVGYYLVSGPKLCNPNKRHQAKTKPVQSHWHSTGMYS